jgi:hypothetical protein
MTCGFTCVIFAIGNFGGDFNTVNSFDDIIGVIIPPNERFHFIQFLGGFYANISPEVLARSDIKTNAFLVQVNISVFAFITNPIGSVGRSFTAIRIRCNVFIFFTSTNPIGYS